MIKNTFKLLTLILLLVMIIAGCKKEPLSDEQVTKNLAGDWEFNQEHLLGTWKPYMLAYTKDGKKFSERDVISSDYTVEIEYKLPNMVGATQYGPYLDVSFANYGFRYQYPSYYYVHLYEKTYYYKWFGIQYNNLTDIVNEVARHSQNLEQLAEFFADFKFNEPTGEEFKIYTVLEKAYSFVIRNDKLFIYFRGIENVNLLIFKKI